MQHEPPGYRCPFCQLVRTGRTPTLVPQDVVAQTDRALAFIAPRWWPNNVGHVLVIPTSHHENLYELPAAAGHAVHDLVQQMARAIRGTYGCDGTSVRQHNEPAGNQDVWHYHVHVFPRYEGDGLYQTLPLPGFVTAAQRRPYAERIREFLGR